MFDLIINFILAALLTWVSVDPSLVTITYFWVILSFLAALFSICYPSIFLDKRIDKVNTYNTINKISKGMVVFGTIFVLLLLASGGLWLASALATAGFMVGAWLMLGTVVIRIFCIFYMVMNVKTF